MEMHWWCCECNATNSSPDEDQLVCSQENCDHHLCSDCYNPQQIGRDTHMNEHVVSSQITVSQQNITFIKEARSDLRKLKAYGKRARALTGHHVKHSKIGQAFLKFWKYIQRKTGMKKERLRIEGKNMPTIVVPSIAQTSGASDSHYYEPEPTYYTEESYNYEGSSYSYD